MPFPPYENYPDFVAEEIVLLRRRIAASPGGAGARFPEKIVDRNLIIATWNIAQFSRLFESFAENPGSPKRNLRGLAYIAEVIKRFDVVAVQEVKNFTDAFRYLVENYLGPDWDLLFSDVSGGAGGNNERLAYVWDRRRVRATGLAGEIVVPPMEVMRDGQPVMLEASIQFDRTPYVVGFESRGRRFTLLTAHIKFDGDMPATVRIPELRKLAEHSANEIRDRASSRSGEENNLIVLGDFNIDRRGDNPLFQAFISTGLFVPEELRGLRTTRGTEAKFYDQIAWFMGDLDLEYAGNAGVVDFVDAVYREIAGTSLPSRVSDHFPLWAEFIVDTSDAVIAETLGLDPAAPDPFAGIP